MTIMAPEPGLRDLEFPPEECSAADLWVEHGWALSGWQTCGILVLIGLACLLLKAGGG